LFYRWIPPGKSVRIVSVLLFQCRPYWRSPRPGFFFFHCDPLFPCGTLGADSPSLLGLPPVTPKPSALGPPQPQSFRSSPSGNVWNVPLVLFLRTCSRLIRRRRFTCNVALSFFLPYIRYLTLFEPRYPLIFLSSVRCVFGLLFSSLFHDFPSFSHMKSMAFVQAKNQYSCHVNLRSALWESSEGVLPAPLGAMPPFVTRISRRGSFLRNVLSRREEDFKLNPLLDERRKLSLFPFAEFSSPVKIPFPFPRVASCSPNLF